MFGTGLPDRTYDQNAVMTGISKPWPECLPLRNGLRWELHI